MDIRHSLQTYSDDLNRLYQDHLPQSTVLQRTLLDQVLPNVLEDANFATDERAIGRAKDWLEDTASVFRMFKRHKFTSTFAQEALRSALVWRLTTPLTLENRRTTLRLLHPLSPLAQDFLGRPVVVLRLAVLDQCQEDIKTYMLCTLELLRIQLSALNTIRESEGASPILQYVLLVDMAGVSLRTINVDLLTWYMRDAVPRFPGLLAAVFMLNYSWTHSGVWNVLKRILPDSALSKVFFPSREDLHRVILPSSLPKDYGGLLPALDTITIPDPRDDLDRIADVADTRQMTDGDVSPRDHEDRPRSTPVRPPSRPSTPPHTGVQHHPTPAAPQSPITARSRLNPFFGYPIAPTSASNRIPTPTTTRNSAARIPKLHHGRQRKRDLVHTLAVLWWERWRTHATVSVVLVLLTVLLSKLMRRSSTQLSPWWSWIQTWGWRWAGRRGRGTL
ncbi:CRAL-TRIO domain-containing protein [Amylostereum chailletii]|nr:CRAL-TRIO domain-containing protein [Amylostereum chailletii]